MATLRHSSMRLSASGSWAGLDLGTAQVITQVKYCPRATFGSRMVGGVFQGSNASDFSGAVTLYTVAVAPADGAYTTQAVSNGTGLSVTSAFSVRPMDFVMWPTCSFLALEAIRLRRPPLRRHPTPTPPPGGGQLTGSVIGTAGSYGGQSNTIDKVYDGNLATFFDAPVASGAWAGLDLGSAKVVNEIKFCPRATFASRMTGGVFQGANAADFSGAVTLHTVSGTPTEGTLASQSVSNGTAFRYVRYLSPANGWCNIAEVAFFGPGGSPTPTPNPPPTAPSAPSESDGDGGQCPGGLELECGERSDELHCQSRPEQRRTLCNANLGHTDNLYGFYPDEWHDLLLCSHRKQ